MLKDIISIRIHPLDPGDHTLPQKLLVDSDVDLSLAAMKMMVHFWLPLSTTSSTIRFGAALRKGGCWCYGQTQPQEGQTSRWLLWQLTVTSVVNFFTQKKITFAQSQPFSLLNSSWVVSLLIS